MLTQWIERLASGLQNDQASSDTDSTADMERLSAQLLIEVARADDRFEDDERRSIFTALQRSSSLSPADIEQIIDQALEQADTQVSLHALVGAVNDHFDKPQKRRLIEQMWRVALADGDIDKYEEYTIRKLADLLYVKHRDFMQAKVRVLDETDEGDR